MKYIKPISALRDTSKIDEEANAIDEPIFITKNGYGDLVLMNENVYYSKLKNNENLIIKKREGKAPSFSSIQDDSYGFVRCSCPTIISYIGNVNKNIDAIVDSLIENVAFGAKVIVFPELCVSGYSVGDLFLDEKLLSDVENGLVELVNKTKNIDAFFVVGAPLQRGNHLYNCAIAIHKGKLLGVVPKSFIPNYGEFYEKRYFIKAPRETSTISIKGVSYPFGTNLLFVNERMQKLVISIEICEDAWVPLSPSQLHSLAGSTLVCNLSSSNDYLGKEVYRSDLIKALSSRLKAAYLYGNTGKGESSSDLVFGSHRFIYECGDLLSESKPFEYGTCIADVDLDRVIFERNKESTFAYAEEGYETIPFSMEIKKPIDLYREYKKNPFLPKGNIDLDFVNRTISMQAHALLSRLQAIHSKNVVIGISGGLDSTLALLVAVEAFKLGNLDFKGINAVTMPCFATTTRTKTNAEDLCLGLGVTLRTVDIGPAVKLHLKDIGHDENDHGIAYENAQARERTQILMDIANDVGGIVVGTGDLSELCLGWCTYGGDHLSMFGVNASIPKTMVIYCCEGYAIMHPEVKEPLMDIVKTPISPELLPSKNGQISQLTEEKIGPYALHDFFLYYYLTYRLSPRKLYFIANATFDGVYDKATIKKWMKEFFRRFFINQFKRNCLPDGPKVTCVSVSPRGDLRMPSDADKDAYLREIEELD